MAGNTGVGIYHWFHQWWNEKQIAVRIMLFLCIIGIVIAGSTLFLQDYEASLSGIQSFPVDHSNETIWEQRIIAVIPQLAQVVFFSLGMAVLTKSSGTAKEIENARLTGIAILTFATLIFFWDLYTDVIHLQLAEGGIVRALIYAIVLYWFFSEIFLGSGLVMFWVILPEALEDIKEMFGRLKTALFSKNSVRGNSPTQRSRSRERHLPS